MYLDFAQDLEMFWKTSGRSEREIDYLFVFVSIFILKHRNEIRFIHFTFLEKKNISFCVLRNINYNACLYWRIKTPGPKRLIGMGFIFVIKIVQNGQKIQNMLMKETCATIKKYLPIFNDIYYKYDARNLWWLQIPGGGGKKSHESE